MERDKDMSAEESQVVQSEPTVLSKADILGVKDLDVRLVDMRPFGWSGAVYVRALDGTSRDAWEASMLTYDGKKARPNLKDTRAKLLQLTLCDQYGRLLFDQSEIPQLGQRSAKALDHLYDIAREMSGIGDEALRAAVKNSEPGQSASSIAD